MDYRTDGPGFTRDEDVTAPGSAFELPPWIAVDRASLDERLSLLEVGAAAGAD